MTNLSEIIRIYETPVQEGKSRFDIWEEAGAVGSSITPSTFSPEYRSTFVALVERLVPPEQWTRVLSLGCGNAFIERDLFHRGYDVLATDISAQALEYARKKGLKTQYVDATQHLPFPSDSFNLIFSDGIVGHMLNEKRSIDYFIDNCASVLSRQGIILLGNDSSIQQGLTVQKHDALNYWWVSKEFLEESLRKKGFKDVTTELIPYERPNYGTRIRVVSFGSRP